MAAAISSVQSTSSVFFFLCNSIAIAVKTNPLDATPSSFSWSASIMQTKLIYSLQLDAYTSTPDSPAYAACIQPACRSSNTPSVKVSLYVERFHKTWSKGKVLHKHYHDDKTRKQPWQLDSVVKWWYLGLEVSQEARPTRPSFPSIRFCCQRTPV